MISTSNLITVSITNLRRVFQIINEQSKKSEHEIGLTHPQLCALKVISELGPLKVTDIARNITLHPATVVGILDRLEKRELIIRTRSKKDRRVVEVVLTEQGKQIVASSPEMAQKLLIKGLEELSRSNLRRIANGLGQLVAIMGNKDLLQQLTLSTDQK